MALQNLAKADTLADRVATEILKALAARRQSQAALARAMEVPAMWVSDRLSGKTQITINDLERIATTLGVKVPDLLSGAVTDTFPAFGPRPVPRQRSVSRHTRPVTTKPVGRPSGSSRPDGSRRTSRVA